jgi:sporulation protein YlmC with PRC-barrel domain
MDEKIALGRKICYNNVMLITIQNMLGAPVMSLQTGQPLATLDGVIIDPHNLKIVAFYVSGPLVEFSPAVLFSEDIREFGEMGAIVDSSDNILSPEGMVRLGEVIDYGFTLEGIWVVDDHKHKLGKVENYTLNPENLWCSSCT